MSMSDPPNEPTPSAAPPAAAIVSERITELRGEAEALSDKGLRAAFGDAVGRLLVREPGGEAHAVREFLGAFNHDPTFRPPLFALVDGFERRRAYKNLGRLYDAEAKSATEPHEKHDALLDRASLLLITAGDVQEVDALLNEVLNASPTRASTWLMLEFLAERRGLAEMATKARRERANLATTPAWRATLLQEVASETSDADDAFALVQQAALADPTSIRAQRLLEQGARERRGYGILVEALVRRAEAAPSGAARAALFVEASILTRIQLGDAERALTFARNATTEAPEDLVAWLEFVETAEAAESFADVELGCARVLALGGDDLGTEAAAIHFRRTEAAMAEGRSEDAEAHLASARAAAPNSRALYALVAQEPSVLAETRAAAIDAALAELAEDDLEARVALLLERAHLASSGGASEASLAALTQLVTSLASGTSATVEAWRAKAIRDALVLAQTTQASAPLETLLRFVSEQTSWVEGSDELRSTWRFTALLLASRAKVEASTQVALARAALADEACGSWSAQTARQVAIAVSNDRLLADAHTLLAAQSDEADVVAAHLVASARALVRVGDASGAQKALGDSLQKKADGAYARALLEEVGRKEGDLESVLKTLRGLPDADPADVARKLVAAAYGAETSGNDDLALATVEEALTRGPSIEASHLLLRIALRRKDEALATRARAGLEGFPWQLSAALSLAPEARDAALVEMLDVPAVALEAALALTAHGASTERTRSLLGEAFAAPSDPLEALRTGASAAWMDLADQLQDEAENNGAVVHALRVQLHREGVDDDGFLRIAELQGAESSGPDAGLVFAEVMMAAAFRGEPIDAAEWASSHASYAERSELREVRDTQARWLVAAGRGDESLKALEACVQANPNDAAALDSLRVASREAKAWALTAKACDGLASLVTGEVRAQLLEEAAALYMDELADDEAAEARCLEAMKIDPRREIAYARLHDLLAERGDDAALLDLVNARSELFDDPDLLAPLMYEQARLFRGLNQVDDALASLENLLLLEPEHLAGLALQVEIYVQRDAFADAVESLRAIASSSSAPASQRRIARLGAAEFLDKKLGDAAGALAELQAIERELKLTDRVVFDRIASLAERLGRSGEAATARSSSAETSSDPKSIAAAHRKNGLEAKTAGRMEDAAQAFRRALEAMPDDVEAVEALADIPGAGDAEERVQGVLVALRRGAFPVTLDQLSKLERAARLGGEWSVTAASQELQRAFDGSGSPTALSLSKIRLLPDVKFKPLTTMTESPVLAFARLTAEALLELDAAEFVSLGASRADLKPQGTDSNADVLHAIAGQFGVAGDVFLTGESRLLHAGVVKARPAYVMGKGLRGSALSYDAAFLCAGAKLGLLPLSTRASRGGLHAVSTALAAFASACGFALAIESRDGFSELARALSKVLSRESKKAASDLAPSLQDPKVVAAWVRDFHYTLVRAATFCSGDAARGLAALTGTSAKVEVVAASEQASSLARDWLRPEWLTLRGELGWRTE